MHKYDSVVFILSKNSICEGKNNKQGWQVENFSKIQSFKIVLVTNLELILLPENNDRNQH